jgi:hypothetical protein
MGGRDYYISSNYWWFSNVSAYLGPNTPRSELLFTNWCLRGHRSLPKTGSPKKANKFTCHLGLCLKKPMNFPDSKNEDCKFGATSQSQACRYQLLFHLPCACLDDLHTGNRPFGVAALWAIALRLSNIAIKKALFIDGFPISLNIHKSAAIEKDCFAIQTL